MTTTPPDLLVALIDELVAEGFTDEPQRNLLTHTGMIVDLKTAPSRLTPEGVEPCFLVSAAVYRDQGSAMCIDVDGPESDIAAVLVPALVRLARQG